MTKEILQNFDATAFRQQLIEWYEINKRILPWRENQDPYRIWVSEVMLQQTQVDTVIPYFQNFMEKFPTVYHLAEAEEQEVLKAWEGLGYYSRARNLHFAVKEVVEKYDGRVPREKKELLSLKGIGPYTCGAIRSIAFDEAEAAVDGNVMRVISRILKIEDNTSLQKVRKQFEEYVAELISHENPSSFNQGLMELGALICSPKSPKCHECPVQNLCRAHQLGVEEQLPIKAKPKKQKELAYVSLLIRNEEGEILIEQRPNEGLLANLWQFMMVPIDEVGLDHLKNWVYSEYGVKIEIEDAKPVGSIKHIFSHIIWEIDVYRAITKDDFIDDQRLKFVQQDELVDYPFPVSHLNMMKFLAGEEA